MRKEIQVNVLDLIKYMCKQWKKLFIAALCGMILVSAGYCVVGLNKNTDVEIQPVDKMQIIEEARKLLTEKEALEAEQALEFYLSSQENYKILKSYTANSWLYKIDASSTPTYRIVYSIQGAYRQDKDFSDEVGIVFENWIKSDEAVQKILEYSNVEIGSVYLNELISVNYEETTSCFVIAIVAPERDVVEKLALAVDAAVAENAKKIAGEYDDLAVKKVLGNFSYEINNSIQSKQYNMMQQLHAVKSVLTAYRYELTSNQQSYYDALLNGMNESQVIVQSAQAVPLFDVKIAILGAIAGVFAMVFIALLKYLLSDSLKVKEDIEQAFERHVFGEYVVSKLNQNDWIMLCESIKYLASKNGMKKLLIASSCMDSDVETFEQNLKDELKVSFENIEFVYVDKNNTEILKYVKTSDCALCIEKIQKSSYSNIQREIDLCDYYGVPMLGFVLVK